MEYISSKTVSKYGIPWAREFLYLYDILKSMRFSSLKIASFVHFKELTSVTPLKSENAFHNHITKYTFHKQTYFVLIWNLPRKYKKISKCSTSTVLQLWAGTSYFTTGTSAEWISSERLRVLRNIVFILPSCDLAWQQAADESDSAALFSKLRKLRSGPWPKARLGSPIQLPVSTHYHCPGVSSITFDKSREI